MMVIRVISGIDATHEGPKVEHSSGEWKNVHLHQGSLDGACGPYCLFMALMICRVIDRDELLNDPPDRRSRHGRLLREFEKYSGFFMKGTTLKNLADHVRKAHGRTLRLELSRESGKDLRRFVEGWPERYNGRPERYNP